MVLGPLSTGDVLTSARLEAEGFRHGFFTRRGGVSPAPWASLNFAANTGDALERVRENVARAAAWLGVAPERVFFLSQVHGVHVERLRGGESRDDVVRREGDAVLGAAPDLACGVRSADCATVLLADRRSGAVCAVHAGWRGTALGVVGAAVRALEAAGSRPSDLVAAVGPHIERCCFEVGDDVARRIAASSSAGESAVERAPAKPRVDLRRVIDAQLVSAGLDAAAVDHVAGCTACDAERFFSFRRDGRVSGRMLAAVVPRG